MRRFTRPAGVVLPCALAALPALYAAIRLLVVHPPVYYLGDQAAEDVLAHDAIRGHDLLGVYSRYGWHHPGPMWLDLLGLFRLPVGTSTIAASVGGLCLQAAWGVVACLAARRLAPRLLWPTAGAVALVYWSLGYLRMVSLWNPWAVAVPTLVLLLAVAGAMAAPRPGPWLVLIAVTATYLVQTDVSTTLLVVVMVAAAIVAVAVRALRRRDGEVRHRLARWSVVSVLALVVCWAQPLWQQASGSPGNLRQLWRFELAVRRAHQINHPVQSIRAVDTILGLFPFRVDAFTNDALPSNLTSHAVVDRPFLWVYLAVSVLLAAWAIRRRDRPTAALSVVAVLGLVALYLSAQTAYGLLYPYLLLWAIPVAALPWVALVGLVMDGGWRRQVVGAGATVAAAAVALSMVVPYAAATGIDEGDGQATWALLAPLVMAPGVHTIEARTATPGADPLVDALVDATLNHHRQIDLDPADGARYDPERAKLRQPAQLRVVFCCGTGPDAGPSPLGMRHLGAIEAFQVYVARPPAG